MRVVICGAGQVGYGIAEKLAAEKNDVSVIDLSPELIRNVRDALDVRGFVGHGAHPDVLEAAGAKDADMIIAVTFHDEVNMIACQVAHSLFEVPTKIARIRAQAYLQPHAMGMFSRDNMPIDVIISPELEVGEMVLRRIALPGAADAVGFADDRIIMVALECLEDCPVVDTPLSQLSELFPDLLATVVGISRGGRLFVASSQDQLAVGDIAYVVASKQQVRRTMGLFGHDEEKAARIVIAGAGNIGLHVARAIENGDTPAKVKIIEAGRERAVAAADSLRRTIVLHGSALDQKLLMEADIAEADLLVALTNDDQVNILSGVMAKRLGCRANLVLINNPTYHDFAGMLGVDAYINPRMATISRILQQVRRGRIRAVHSVQHGAAEIIEAEALETSPLVGRPLRELDLPEGIRLGAILRDNAVIRPNGSLRIKPKDRVVIFAMASAVRQVEQMFRVSLEFF
ncbi:MAG: Trk system potassium transporter TrkA [Neoaquamicrobium sediminum]|jgi:trk system potassium uptake protein TrkA|uniref:Trk system potassium uptake protein TrkA n=1 Tax=Neoaquamicrobium sediminum TaxID=1849104 RepID=A0ABV3WTN8_9HYPH|nr:Trk system potassium transporter TrkA [Mesorhizobium sediminum]MBX9452073.1 Trk system potassium transporter TrkA [Mesorhizobium sp.]NRC55141.1 Trk system potassium transporter TrkA [Mesorhizobium sediminum]